MNESSKVHSRFRQYVCVQLLPRDIDVSRPHHVMVVPSTASIFLDQLLDCFREVSKLDAARINDFLVNLIQN